MKWLRLILAGYAAVLLLGLATLAAMGTLEPLAMQWAVLEIAIGLGLGVLIAIAGDDREKTRRLRY